MFFLIKKGRINIEYIYDKEGSLIQTIGNNNKIYEYDAFNQLKAVNRVTNVKRESIANETGMKRGKTSSNAFINYEYSPLGWRESKTVKSSEENYTEKYYYLGANIFETRKERGSNGNEMGMNRGSNANKTRIKRE